MAAGAETGFPFDDVSDGVAFTFHGPNHRDRTFVMWNGAYRDDFPMLAFDVVLKFLLHGFDKLETVGSLHSFVECHGIRIGGTGDEIQDGFG